MQLSQAAEAELIRTARAGDDLAYGELIQAHLPGLYRVARRIAPDPAEAEALVQEAFLRVWQNLARLQGDRPLFPYLATVVVNLGRDRWRKARRETDFELESIASEPDREPGPESQVEYQELLVELAQAVDQLPPVYRAVIALRYDAGMSYQEIAVALDLPLNTVRTHLRRAKETLRRSLEGGPQTDG